MFEAWSAFLTLMAVVLGALLVWAALAPFETLGWWAGWFGDKIYHDDLPPDGLVRAARPQADCYLLFLSGVGRVSGETFSWREQEFLRRLAVALPQAVVIDDIFPYAVNNLPLTGQPVFARLWRWAFQRKINGSKWIGYLINLRNIWQVFVSADKRYGPIYNQGLAEVLIDGLLRYGYNPTDAKAVYVVGYSGAGQMAVGAARYLREWLRGPVYLVSLAGVFTSDPALLQVNHTFHLYGTNDNAHKLSLIAPGRWPIATTSAWNRARRAGRITELAIGPMGHTGRGGYLDAKNQLPDGTFYMDRTVAAIAGIVKQCQGLPDSL
jgi:hypothetical protein